jgi:hypothetical protein
MVLLLISILFSFAIAELNSIIDHYIITVKERSVNHFTRAVLRFILFTSVSYFTSNSVLGAIILFSLQSAIFWLWFDLRLNMRRWLSPFYIGKTAFIDKTIIRFKFSGEHLFLFKVFIVISFLCFAIYQTT